MGSTNGRFPYLSPASRPSHKPTRLRRATLDSRPGVARLVALLGRSRGRRLHPPQLG